MADSIRPEPRGRVMMDAMPDPTGGQTLFLPKGHPQTSPRQVDTGLPTDLISQSAFRLRTLALLYAFVFFMAGIFPALLFAESRAMMASHTVMWLPATVSILLALAVAFVACSKFISLSTSMTIGLVFEVLGSYGIALAEFPDPMGFSEGHPQYLGLSWVAVWTMLFTVVVPTSPKRTLVSALLSVSAVPVTVAIFGTRYLEPSPELQLFFGFTFPYLLVVLMAYVGSHVVYGLGKEVSRARELGSYVLVERIGHGGMGEVWRAKHRLLARPAAIKLIRPALTSGHGSVLVRRGPSPLRARSADDFVPAFTPHRGSLRLWRRRRRCVLLRDGVARRSGRRLGGAAKRADAA